MDESNQAAGHTEIASQLADEARLRDFLRDRDVPCPLCQYNLRGLISSRCPECGQSLKLSVGLAEPYIAAWVTLAVASWASAGPGLVLLIIVANYGLPGDRDLAQMLMTLGVLYCIASIPIAIIALLKRRWFMARERSTQWLYAGTVLALTIGASLGFIYAIVAR